MFWVGIAVAAVVVVLLILGAVVGYVAVSRVQQAGVSADLLKENPGFAMNKVIVSSMTDVEIVSEEPAANEIVVRSKKTGQVFVHRIDETTKRFHLVPVDGEQP